MIHTSIPYKGLKLLEEIIPRIQKRHPDTKFKIFSSMSLYGDDQLDKYVDTYQKLKTYPNVEYSRAVPQEQLVSHYQESAFFIHPNTWEETFCVSMAEAMRCGAYPIITSIGAIAEVAGEGNASIVPMDGKPTNTGYEVTEDFINNFTGACCESLDIFDNQRQLYDEVSKNISIDEGEIISVSNIGDLIENPATNKTSKEIFANSWIYNTSVRFKLESINNATCTTKGDIDRSSLKIDDKVEILESNSNNVVFGGDGNLKVNSIDDDAQGITRVITLSVNTNIVQLEEGIYDIRRRINSAFSDIVPLKDGTILSDVQNLYVGSANTAYIASNSLP